MDLTHLQARFPPSLHANIAKAIQQHPAPTELVALFEDIARLASWPRQGTSELAIASKKRKLDDDVQQPTTNGTEPVTITYTSPDLSVQIPLRKKLKLSLVASHQDEELRLTHPTTGDVEYTLPVSEIEEVFCLPVPEKQQRQWNFVILGTEERQVVFTMNEGNGAVEEMTQALGGILKGRGREVTVPDEKEFRSAIPQSHRKGEAGWHVKAHRGSKEGYLFFLPNGVIFGFKKPLAFFPFAAIESISYTSVLQRTFNLVVTSQDADGEKSKEDEFGMIDQADFAGIDEYVKRHGLNDASMAMERRARAFNVNKEKKEGGGGEGEVDGEGESELQKAEQQLQDAEDEEEEDYVESGGESDGEGEYSSEDEEEDGDEREAEEVEHYEDVHDDD